MKSESLNESDTSGRMAVMALRVNTNETSSPPVATVGVKKEFILTLKSNLMELLTPSGSGRYPFAIPRPWPAGGERAVATLIDVVRCLNVVDKFVVLSKDLNA
jgi:hypothetical protein